GGELVVLLHEILSGFQIPQVAVVLVVPVRSLGGTSALGDCPTEVEKPRLGVERQVGRVAVLLGVVLRYREADVCFLCFEVPHDEVILVEEGNVFAVGTDVQGVFGDIAESVFGLSCLEVSESDRERSQGGDTILVDEECPVDEIVDLPSPGGGQFPGVHVHHTQGGKTVFEAAVRLHVDEHGGTRGRKIHRLNGTWIDQPVQCTFRLRPQVFMEFTRRDVESCVKADRRIFVLITRGAHGDHAPDGGED